MDLVTATTAWPYRTVVDISPLGLCLDDDDVAAALVLYEWSNARPNGHIGISKVKVILIFCSSPLFTKHSVKTIPPTGYVLIKYRVTDQTDQNYKIKVWCLYVKLGSYKTSVCVWSDRNRLLVCKWTGAAYAEGRGRIPHPPLHSRWHTYRHGSLWMCECALCGDAFTLKYIRHFCIMPEFGR